MMPMSPSETLFGALSSTRNANADSWSVPVASVVLLAGVTAAAAQVSVPLPFTPVPFTFQPMVVLLGGLALGARLGASAQVLYLVAGIVGLPVFAASATLPPGASRLLGPTGGYLLSYPLAAFIVGRLAERGFARTYMSSVTAMFAGLAVVYSGGVAMLALALIHANPSFAETLRTAFLVGVWPFVAGDLVKLLLGATIVPSLWWLIRSQS